MPMRQEALKNGKIMYKMRKEKRKFFKDLLIT